MTDQQDTNSTADAGPGESLQGSAQTPASQISPAADALSDNSLDDVSGGTWPFNNLARASYASEGPGG
ncbi:hypothetical protein XI09_00750 [Bradyrhizobium sp. CCBAU 11386]|uniref:hypothetical protein n=1 Tax=Bradyrhizobium sp. CCBAU 11386 TaxID=1630837 RepID=UPI002302F1D3|nr:hypothetical protein [Bradyrhizobium sp. CCBAU 11386]MDA9503396.1 hypothetical protein [Bradyrhizobium sp. CCBAU 11386]